MRSPEARYAPKRPFSETVEFVKQRIAESRRGETLPDHMEPGVAYPLPHVDFPKFSNSNTGEAKYRNALALYLGTDLTLKQIGEMIGFVTRERVRQIIKRAIEELHATASSKLKQAYPLEELTFTKPISQPILERRSQVRGGVTLGIRAMLEQGASRKDLRAAGFSTGQIQGARRVLRGWNNSPEMPYSQADWSDIVDLFQDPATHRVVLNELLKDVPQGTYQKQMEKGTGIFITLSEILTRSEIPYGSKSIGKLAEALEKKYCIGFGSFTIKSAAKGKSHNSIQRFTLKRFSDEIAIIVQKDPHLLEIIRPPELRVIAGPAKDVLPNPNSLVNRPEEHIHGISAVSSMTGIEDRKIRALTNRGINFFDGSPVSIYRYARCIYVGKADSEREEFKEFVKKRAQELGLI
jgi:hypothetical protein